MVEEEIGALVEDDKLEEEEQQQAEDQGAATTEATGAITTATIVEADARKEQQKNLAIISLIVHQGRILKHAQRPSSRLPSMLAKSLESMKIS